MKRRAVCGASMYNEAHTSDGWARARSIDMEGDEYVAYEAGVSRRAYKEAKMRASTVRSNFKGKGTL